MNKILLTSLLLVSFTAHAEVYKCPLKDGRVVFQDRPCEGGAQIEIQSAPSAPAAGQPAEGLREGERKMLEQAELSTAASHGEVKPGMSQIPPAKPGACNS